MKIGSKLRSRIEILVLLLVLSIGIVACSNKSEEPISDISTPVESVTTSDVVTEDDTKDESITVTDMKGRDIVLDEEISKIVVLNPGDCEILYALGAGDKIIGRGEYCDYPAEVMDVEGVATGIETNLEAIIALEPQVVIMSTMAQTQEQIEVLEKAGIKVAVTDANDIKGVYAAISMLGKLVGKDEAARKLVEDMNNTFDTIKTSISSKAGDKKETVYFEVSPLEYGLWTAGKNTFMNELADILGLENCFADVDGWGEVSQEQVLERNPDVIVSIAMYFGEGDTPDKEIMARSGWDKINAVKNEKVIFTDSNVISRPGPRLMEAAKLLYDTLYAQ